MIDLGKADVAIVGGGITGTAIARELSKYRLNIVLVEKHPDLAMGSTKANSAVLHAGFAQRPGSLKALLNVRGSEMYRKLKEELDLEIDFVGSLVIALSPDELVQLQELYDWGMSNQVAGLKLLNREEVFELEKNLTPNVCGALLAPTAGIIWPFGAALAFAESAVCNGVRIITECQVTGIKTEAGKVAGLHTNKGFLTTGCIINAAGVYADEISRMAGDESFVIRPRKGEYILFDKSAAGKVGRVIFPVPQNGMKGILLSPTVHGNMFIGPNACDLTDKEDVAVTTAGLEEVISGGRRLMPDIPLGAAIAQFAGLRAVSDKGDFIVRRSAVAAGLIHAAGIESPGLTAAPAIAEMIADLVRDFFGDLVAKPDFVAFCPSPRRRKVHAVAYQERQKLIAENPLYGRIVCRCETVSEGEIIEAIHRPCGARTVDGVKRRVGAGLGRCQGGFCGPRVVAILARELDVPVTAIRKDCLGSEMFFDKLPGECGVAP